MNINPYYNNIGSDSVKVIINNDDKNKDIFLYPTEIGFLDTRFPYFFSQSTTTNDGFLIVFTVSGTGMLKFNGLDYKLEFNNLVYIPCKQDFKFSASKFDYRWRFLYMFFNGSLSDEYYSYIMKDKSPVGNVDNSDSIMASLWQIINRYKLGKEEPYSGLITFSNILEVLTEIATLNTPLPTYNLACPGYIKSIFSYIDLNYTDKITLDILENKFAINKYHIARQFKKHSGTTINDYIILKRLERSKFLLKHTDKSINEIADITGFYDSAHFINQFKLREKITPHSYRKVVKI